MTYSAVCLHRHYSHCIVLLLFGILESCWCQDCMLSQAQLLCHNDACAFRAPGLVLMTDQVAALGLRKRTLFDYSIEPVFVAIW